MLVVTWKLEYIEIWSVSGCVLCWKPKCMANGLIPLNFPNQFQKLPHMLETIEKLFLKTADHTVAPTQASAVTLCLTPAVCRERTEQLEDRTVCVCMCVCIYKRAQLGMHTLVWMCVFTCAQSYKIASVLVAQDTASARFNPPLNATVTPGRLCAATYLRWRRYGKNLWTSKSWRLHGSS